MKKLNCVMTAFIVFILQAAILPFMFNSVSQPNLIFVFVVLMALHHGQRIGIITALNPYLGYETSASIAKEALETDGSVIDIVLARNLLSREKLDDILAPEHMINRK